MSRLIFLVIISFFFLFNNVYSQTVKGRIFSTSGVVPFANVVIEGVDLGVSADENGDYIIHNVPLGGCYIVYSAIGMISKRTYHEINKGVNVVDVNLDVSIYSIDQVVVTATKTEKRSTSSPVIVGVIDSRKLESVQACNLAEGLNFQTGLRVETDCQTCNYTQLRMNGLPGGYSQILINGKSIFSPLTGLYGMDQIPANMIERIEVVRGGGSSLYGSSAVGGVVNVITKLPNSNNYILGFDYSSVNFSADDRIVFGNATVISDQKKSGATFFVNNRHRMWYDHNADNYSELPVLRDNTFGANLFFVPSDYQKIEISIGSLHEYRYGGEMVVTAPHLAMQSEERVHDVLLGNIDYQLDFNDGNSSFVAYLASQKTEREHYTGIRPEVGSEEDAEHLTAPPYGSSFNFTKQAGVQLNFKLDKLFGSNVMTLGSEYLSDDVKDEILAYNYLIDQKIVNVAAFIQSDWDLTDRFCLLSGVRFDKHSLLDKIIVSPRFSFLYKLRKETQFRVMYSTGFRAPQAFDTDLHIAFSGGGVSRIVLSDNLKEERSESFSASVNYDKATGYYIYGFTFEGFYTYLDGAFYQDPSGEDEFGDVFMKRNGSGAIVKGVTAEFRLNLVRKIHMESGVTLQSSMYDEPVSYSNVLPVRNGFLKTPSRYGYVTFTYNPSSSLAFSGSLLHTGEMDLIHFSGAPEQDVDGFVVSPSFNSIGLKVTYVHLISRVGVKLEYSFGVKNLTNSYQQNFDTLKNRDSNFVYGPSLPRTIFAGLTLKSL